ncbi:hypothetical protein PsAD2_02980 [Pseudovibrio axinellae]|uniref:PAS domain protein n=1 Tax=Pseudovibrio axinellae TaxID=989403 RepID=A0A165XEY3_9HYPH|nr:hypothetical protein [Pseudovibrio axinellae]KZL17644.1 hypothetical protein PsAD2_02980 [Pseudovibrio axinellae]SER45172.1 hypothetical protein SAMN05421798_110102 [Pseudovibrio axinellae]
MTTIINYPTNIAEQGLLGSQAAQLFETWRENSFCLNHNFLELLPYLNHFANPMDNAGVTDILMVGDKSYLASVYGASWTNDSPLKRAQVDPVLMKTVSTDYEISAQSLAPRLDLLCTPIALPQGGVEFVHYFRIILPFRLKHGNITLFSYASPVHQ